MSNKGEAKNWEMSSFIPYLRIEIQNTLGVSRTLTLGNAKKRTTQECT